VWRDLLSGTRPAEPADQFTTKQNVRFGPVKTPEGEWGYLRVFTFDDPDSLTFLRRAAAVLRSLPQDGLILDLRANPGGVIPSGEALAQLFTNEDITPQSTSFRNTRATRALGQLPQFSRWRRSLDMQMETGDVYSQGFPLTSDGLAPRGVYLGPVALIVDSLCYSTTDFLSAGMQDQRLATIIGTDPVTGAGGANVWTQGTLNSLVTATGSPGLGPLPRDMNLTVAMRRSARVGPNAGLPVEGVGVLADVEYSLTGRDVLQGNHDLIAFASRVLSSMRS
jgi:C-terminal processing protease CtpA/Prc